MKLRTAIVGAGIGRMHADNLRRLPDLFDIAVICDLDGNRASALARRAGCPDTETDFEAVLARPDVDVVHICTPPFLHVEQTCRALEAGKHVVCEKPLAGSLADVDRVAVLARDTGRIVLPVFQMRAGNGVRKLIHLRERGLLGRHVVTTVETAWLRRADYYAEAAWRGKWASELGGCLTTHAIHAHDLVGHILGPPVRLTARAQNRLTGQETEDLAHVQLDLADGSFAVSTTTLASAEEISRFRFVFENVTVESNVAPYRAHYDTWRFVGADAQTREAIDRTLEHVRPDIQDLAFSLRSLHAAITQGGEPAVGLADARASIEFLTAAYYSAATDAPVTLPIHPDHPFHGGWRRAP